MEDRFKFRFFDKKKQKMMYENSDFSDYCKDEWWGYEEQMALEALDVFDNPEHYILMQCTGLKDKNGKLIFEGDIVKFGEFYDNEWHSFDIGKVYWGGKFDYPAFELQCSTADFNTCNGLSYIFCESLSIEVIGNIYENKEF